LGGAEESPLYTEGADYMSLSKKAIGRRFGLLAAFVAALLIACTGVVLAQSSSSSTPNSGYGNTTVTPSDVDQTSSTAEGTAATADVSAEARVPNGGFETGDFSRWKQANQSGGSGRWFVYSGTTSPLSFSTIAAPPQGNFAATTDQEIPGSHVLYRNIKLAAGQKHILSFFLYYDNDAGEFFPRRKLDYTVEPNQQYRVDLLRPQANPFTVNSNKILRTLFRTKVGDPNKRGPQLRTYNISQYAGRTVRLRFAEVDNQDPFLASVDRVRVASTSR
jgi:hypothetical protein